MASYLDILGLTYQQDEELPEYVAALDVPDDAVRIETEAQRQWLLASSVHGAGFTIFTGPKGADYWLPVSLEVNVRLVPDGTDMNERLPLGTEWALRAQGMAASPAKNLAKRETAPTRGKNVEPWNAALALCEEVMTTQVKPIVLEQYPVTIIRDLAEQVQFLDALEGLHAIDGEWSIENPSELHGISVSNADHNWYLPVRALDFEQSEADTVLREAFARTLRRIPTITHNGKADLKALWPGDPIGAYGCDMHDTIVMAYLLGETELSLKALTRAFLGRDPMEYPIGHEGGLATLPVEVGARYAGAGDTRNTYDLYVLFRAMLQQAGRQWVVYENVEKPLVSITASMEWGGTAFDVEEAKKLHEAFFYMHEGLRSMWWARTHEDISTDAGTRAVVKLMTGYDPGSVAQDNLAKIEDEWMDSILAYRRIRHRDRGFLVKHIERWEAAGRPEDYMLYSSFNQAGSADQHDARSFKRAPRSGRYSSSGDAGNLTNQPGDIRSTFTAPKGKKFWSLDYSGLELHIIAALSQDPTMISVLTKACDLPDEDGECPHKPKCGDLHDAFNHDILTRTKVNVGRTAAKQGNFSGAYGGHADMLVTILNKQRAHITYETAKLIADTRRETFPLAYQYNDSVVSYARSNGGYSETYFGRRRTDLDLFSYEKQSQGHAERALINHTIQGTAADILKMAMLMAVPLLHKYGAHIALQIHDEIAGWVDEDVADEFVEEMRAMMESIELPGLRLKATGGAGDNWNEVH